jgi:NAD dependent epimerase/dehydratase family enzyme
MRLKKPKTIPEFLTKLALGSDLATISQHQSRHQNNKIKEIYNFQYLEYQNGIKDVSNKAKL